MVVRHIAGFGSMLMLLAGCGSPLSELWSEPATPAASSATASDTLAASAPPAPPSAGAMQFAPPDCGIAVDFPAQPQELNAGGPQPRARLGQPVTGGSAYFVALCQPGLQISEANAQQILGGLVIDAEMTDYQGANVQTNAGRGFAIQGSGPRDGSTYRYQYVLVPGAGGTMIVSVAAPSGAFPPPGGTAFFQSLEPL